VRAVAGAILLVGMFAVGQSEGFMGFLTGICLGFGLILVITGWLWDGGRS
jgi:hypothetical protein